MKAIVFDRIGPPLEVLQLRDVPVPEIRDNEVLIKMVSASINPGDFLFIQNLYPEPKKPHFPRQVVGNHGAGVIVSVLGDRDDVGPAVARAFPGESFDPQLFTNHQSPFTNHVFFAGANNRRPTEDDHGRNPQIHPFGDP